MGTDATDSGKKGWLVSILELGAWFGVLCTGYLADKLSRKYTIVLGKYITRSVHECVLILLDQLYAYFALASLSRAPRSMRRVSTVDVS